MIGTTVLYQSDGASRSTPAITTGAVRRVCGSSLTVCGQLLQALEAWVGQQQEQVQQLIVLAYDQPESSASSLSPMARPTADLLERLGYERSETQLPRSNVVQYEKRLDVIAAKDKHQLLLYNVQDKTNGLKGALTAGVLFIFLVTCAFALAQFMGLDVFENQDLGIPLSSEELNRLQQDEQLQRTTLDDNGEDRPWQSLSLEEQREEFALMKIIEGQDIRNVLLPRRVLSR